MARIRKIKPSAKLPVNPPFIPPKPVAPVNPPVVIAPVITVNDLSPRDMEDLTRVAQALAYFESQIKAEGITDATSVRNILVAATPQLFAKVVAGDVSF